MDIVIDIGNTHVKFAVFDGQTIVYDSVMKADQVVMEFSKCLKQFPRLNQGIISSTAEVNAELRYAMKNQLQLVEFSHQSKINFKNNYESPETLGLDRIALIAAATEIYPESHVLVIDAGTCITYDFKTKENVYEGGAISPGVKMRFKAMHRYTKKLPWIQNLTNTSKFMGKTTQEAMQIGVCRSISYEIDGYIDDYKADYEDLTVVLTGGDYNLLEASIKNSIFATSNFLLKGLHKILQLNTN
jgi:type III pantothenate kinase